ncbi:helix-turn-helix domain-containing protein [Cytobacillus sp. FSL R5-0596]|uniref:helix-turn-helix domain-containing protein n=1 Tax=Cytobacillus sp. FSL R5-0596 TaxID=2954696 RepID=UPI0030FB9234
MSNQTLVGERLKELREFREYSQADLAEALKVKGITVSRETVSKMETGARAISAFELKALSIIFDIEIDYFFEEEEESLASLFRKQKDLNDDDELFLEEVFVTVELLLAQEELHHSDKKIEIL